MPQPPPASAEEEETSRGGTAYSGAENPQEQEGLGGQAAEAAAAAAVHEAVACCRICMQDCAETDILQCACNAYAHMPCVDLWLIARAERLRRGLLLELTSEDAIEDTCEVCGMSYYGVGGWRVQPAPAYAYEYDAAAAEDDDMGMGTVTGCCCWLFATSMFASAIVLAIVYR